MRLLHVMHEPKRRRSCFILHRATPAVTRRKEYDQNAFGHILPSGMLGAKVFYQLFLISTVFFYSKNK